MDYKTLILNIQNSVAEVTLNRPDVRNALDDTLIAELTDCVERLSADTAVRCVVLRGAGAAFSAGADLAWMARAAQYSHAENLADAGAAQRLFAAVAQCPKATIARVHGAAIGGGAGLAAACDLAIATPETWFAFSEVRLGLAPATIAPYVIRKIGRGAARALFITGERITAAEALRLNLVHQVVPMAELDEAVNRQIAQILQAGPRAIAAVKRLLDDLDGKTPQEALDITVPCIADLRTSPEGQEGIQAFLAKRKPNFAEH